MTDTSQTRLAYIAESSYGQTPATPAFKSLRYTQESLKAEVQNVISNEIRPDRNIPDVTRVGLEASGDIGFELSYGTLDDLLEALFQGTWTSNVLKNGVTQRSFTLEKTFNNAAGSQYHWFTGMMVNTMSLQARAQQIVTGSFNLLGQSVASAQAAISGATYTAGNTNPVMNAANNFQGAIIGGVTNPQIMDLSLSIKNNMHQKPVIGSLNSFGIGSGQFDVDGSATLYFENQQAYEQFLSDTYANIQFSLGGVSNMKYTFLLPKLKFTGGEVNTSGNNADVMVTLPFQAVYDSTTGAAMQITRTP